MIKVKIPHYRKIEGDEHERSYTVYLIEVYVSGKFHSVERRYKEFEQLHKKLKKTVDCPEFPPKKVMKWNPKVLEHRRQALESYLQGSLENQMIPRSLLNFLTINLGGSSGSIDSLDNISDDRGISHQVVLGFREDPFLYSRDSGGLPDIVVEGVTQAFYGTDYLK